MLSHLFTSSLSHNLRIVSLLTFPPGFLLLLLTGISSSHVNPAIGILPLFFSAAYSGILLAAERKCACKAAGLTGTPWHWVCDFLCGVGLFVCLVLAWVFMGQGWGWRGGNVMLGTYGSVFLIVNL
jgi:hypothetical protein